MTTDALRTSGSSSSRSMQKKLLLSVAGLGGLLYGVDVGIIGGALPYLEATSGLSAGELSIIVAAVLLGSVFSTLFAGMLADWMGRRKLMALSGLVFIISIPMIALSHGYGPLFLGRLLQGTSGGLIGVVVPLYLAECLPSAVRGKGTGMFQWMLTLGIVIAALIGIYFSYRLGAITPTATASELFLFKDQAWRRIFWVSLPPGLLFVLGTFLVAESPRWLFRRGDEAATRAALRRTRTPEEAESAFEEMWQRDLEANSSAGKAAGSGSLLQRKYVYPFLLSCVILFCNTATGINSVIGYNTNVLLESGLSDMHAHLGYVIFTVVNFLATIFGMMLVDRKGRRFLLMIGTAGIVVSMLLTGWLFMRSEAGSVDSHATVQALVAPDQSLELKFTPAMAKQLLASGGEKAASIDAANASLAVIYSYGGFTGETTFVRSGDTSATTLHVTRSVGVPSNSVEAFFKNPFSSVKAAQTAPLVIERATIGQVPAEGHGWLVAVLLYTFVAFYAAGPGVCVWLALSELMPTRIRSNGMSIALVINQIVATTLAVIFLPIASKHGYSAMFLLFAGFTVLYFLAAALFLPETKGKTLEEIEAFFAKDPVK